MKSPYDAPRSNMDPYDEELEEVEYYDIPTFGIRAGARIIDTIVNLGIGLGAGLMGGILLVIGEIAGVVAPGWDTRIEDMGFLDNLIGMAMNIGYMGVAEWIGGASFGKLILGLRVVDASGQRRVSLVGAVVRNVAFYVDAFFFGLVGYHAMNSSEIAQRYGDRWGGTRVVRAKEMPKRLDGMGRLVLGLCVGSGMGMGTGAFMFVLFAAF